MTATRAGDGFGLAFAAFRVFMSILEPDEPAARRSGWSTTSSGPTASSRSTSSIHASTSSGPTAGRPAPTIGTFINPDTGRPVRVTVLDRVNDPVRQRFTEHWEFAELDELGMRSGRTSRRLTLRWTFRHEMRHLLVRAGFEPVAEYSDYAGSPPAYGKEQIWVARRAAS